MNRRTDWQMMNLSKDEVGFSVDLLSRSLVITIGSGKGGVGKTSLIWLLTQWLASLKINILVVDFDPQCNLSHNFGFAMKGGDSELYSADDIMRKTRPGFAAKCIEPVRLEFEGMEHVSIIPGSPDLEDRYIEVVNPDARFRLHEALRGVSEDFTVVLIDNGPGIGFLQQTSMAASNSIIGVTEMYYNEIEGALTFSKKAESFGPSLRRPELMMDGLVLNEYSERKAVAKNDGRNYKGLLASLGTKRVWTDCAIPSREYLARAVDRPVNSLLLADARQREEQRMVATGLVAKVLEIIRSKGTSRAQA